MSDFDVKLIIIVLFMLQLFYSPMRDADAAQDLLNDAEKQAFFLMTNIRIVLVKFITPSGFDLESVTESLKRSFYFTVSDWDVLASCHCNGQASECDPEVSLGKNLYVHIFHLFIYFIYLFIFKNTTLFSYRNMFRCFKHHHQP